MLHRLDHSGVRSAAAILAIAAMALSVLHGAIPHHRSPTPCHDCETPAAPALPQPAGSIAIRPDAPPDVLTACAPALGADGQARRPRSTRAPPAPDAA